MLHDLLVRPLADAFIDVGVFVAVFAAAAAVLGWRYGDRLEAALQRYPRGGPLLGAVLGVTPGCGGAILVVPLWARGHVSFGTVVAALTATMGDSSWALWAGSPGTALRVHAGLLVAGLLTGAAVDALGIAPRLPAALTGRRGDTAAGVPVPAGLHADADARAHHAHAAVPAQVPAHHLQPALAGGTGAAVRQCGESLGAIGVTFWLLTGAGAAIGIPAAFVPTDPLAAATTSLDAATVAGLAGALACLVVFLRGKGRFSDDYPPSEGPRGLGSALRSAAGETAFVVVWVAVAYVALAGVDTLLGLPLEALPLTGAIGVGIGALVGLVPGCGLQIAFTGLYLEGAASFSALLANAVCQDGDALLPLIALQPRAAVLVSGITVVPALAAGALVLAL